MDRGEWGRGSTVQASRCTLVRWWVAAAAAAAAATAAAAAGSTLLMRCKGAYG